MGSFLVAAAALAGFMAAPWSKMGLVVALSASEKVLSEMNYVQPVREGNGRAQEAFVSQLGYGDEIDFSVITKYGVIAGAIIPGHLQLIAGEDGSYRSSITPSAMLASNGESIPPWRVPASVRRNCSSDTTRRLSGTAQTVSPAVGRRCACAASPRGGDD